MYEFDRIKEQFEEFWSGIVNLLYPSHADNRLHQACRYALLGQGKRVRPLLAALVAHKKTLLSHEVSAAFTMGAACEMVHTFSLIHDDLPCMDDDDYRRGRLTVHKKFDEPTALLAGDALLADSLALLSGAFDERLQSIDIPPLSLQQKALGVRFLSQATGGFGMTLGQQLDIDFTNKVDSASLADLQNMHVLKTGCLFGAAMSLGAVACGLSQELTACFFECGKELGLIFQIQDDLLDDSSTTGKTCGKDAAQNKLTFLTKLSAKQAHAEKITRQKALLDSEIFFNGEFKALKAYLEVLFTRER